MEFGDLKEDKVIQEKLTSLHESVEKIRDLIDTLLNADIYDKLSLKEKVDYDLFLAYSLNTLYWLYLRTKNEDPSQSDVKNQLDRIKEYMKKAKLAHERQTIRPKLDQEAAGRFIKHGINYKNDEQVSNKRIKFAD